jgi:hypothetical protein
MFAWSQLDISAISGSVSAVSEGYQLNYRWILKLLSGENILTTEFGIILAEIAFWYIERK